jgi:FKBP-type peptidyl-prolyl cis-trans isomerase FklB
MFSKTLISLIGAGLLSQTLIAAELTTDQQQYSYAVGRQIGQMLRSQNISEVDSAAFSAGVNDYLANNPSQMSDEQLQAAMKAHFKAEQQKRKQLGDENLAKGKSFREENAKQAKVTTLDNGLQYEVLKAGEGESPKAEDRVEVHYKGMLIDGTEFDSSYKRGTPVQFNLKGVVPGFREAILLMKPGAKWRVVMPPDLAYGEKGAGNTIGPNETLVFEIEYLGLATDTAAKK